MTTASAPSASAPVRVEFWGDEIDRISEINPLTGEQLLLLPHRRRQAHVEQEAVQRRVRMVEGLLPDILQALHTAALRMIHRHQKELTLVVEQLCNVSSESVHPIHPFLPGGI